MRCSFKFVVPVITTMLLVIPVRAEFDLVSLGTLGGGFSVASAINNRGEIVGYSRDATGLLHAFSYRNGVMRSLNNKPCSATAINDAGQIVGSGLTPSTNFLTLPPLSPPILPPFTNPIVIWPTNPIVILPTNPIVIRHTNPIVILPTNPIVILNTNPIVIPPGDIIVPPLPTGVTLSADTAAQEIAVSISSQIVGDSLATNVNTVTNTYYISRPALFRLGALVNLFPGTNSGYAAGINNRGEIVGSVNVNGGAAHAFVYRNGLTTDLGNGVAAMGINNRGDVVGLSISSPPSAGAFPPASEHAFLYRHGLMRDLGTLGGSSAAATAINDVGEIVGWSATSSNAETHAFLYGNGKMTDLGTLGGAPPYGPAQSSALAINNWGTIVGSSIGTNGTHAVLYSNGGITDLNDLVTLTYVNGPAGFLVLTTARGINDQGQIVGEGLFWDGAQVTTRAFLMESRPGHTHGTAMAMFERPGAH